MVAACGILCCGFTSSWSGVELRVMRPVCRMLVYPKHVEQAIRSAIKTSVASSWHFISTYMCQFKEANLYSDIGKI